MCEMKWGCFLRERERERERASERERERERQTERESERERERERQTDRQTERERVSLCVRVIINFYFTTKNPSLLSATIMK